MKKLSKLAVYQKILIIVGACALLFVLLNFGYFWANFSFFIHKPKPVAVPAQTTLRVQEKMQPNTLIIDSLGINAPVVYATSTGETAFQAALINGPTHYPGTAQPGQLGNCYIFGHSSDYIWSKGHYKNVFATLPHIQKGAEIIISDQQGNKFTYLVTDSREVAVNDLMVLDQQGYTKKLLTLQTSYPIGTALARWVAVAEIRK
jgi:LPXTG-site transpeptidase (sortase) family protein